MNRVLLLFVAASLSGCSAVTDAGVPVGPAWVTLAYVGLYYGFQLNVLRVKNRVKAEHAARGEKLDRYFTQDRFLLAADRYQLNMLEHMPVFLVLLWLHAVAVDPGEATIAGAVYVAARVAYPLVLGPRMGRGVPTRILVVTGAGYAVLVWQAVRIGASLL